MIKLLSVYPDISGFLNKVLNAFYITIVIACVVLIVALMLRFPGTRKIMFYIFSGVLIISGIYSTTNFFKEVNQESYINGSATLKNSVIQTDFNYSTNSIVFYFDETNGNYVFTKSFVRSSDFDGSKNTYETKLNNYLLFDSTYSNGAIFSKNTMYFLSSSGDVIYDSYFEIDIQFLSDKTTLKVLTYSEESVNYLQKYFQDFGFRLMVNLLEE